jgi:outer membrane immunogenic protein
MRTKYWSGIGVLASIVAGVGAAGAADLATKAPVYTKAPPPVILSDWAGFYIWQWGQVVAGFEGDFDGASINGTDTLGVVGVKTDELASIRGRLGYSFVPNVLAYGTAGVGFGHTQFTWLDGLAPNESIWQTGWVAGGGLEYKFTPNWILRAEYLHYGFDSGSTNSFSTIKNDLDVVRGGVSYKF